MNTDNSKGPSHQTDINSIFLPADHPAENNDEQSDQITLLAAQINAATYCFLKLLSEFDRRHAWGGAGIRSCAHWLLFVGISGNVVLL